MKNSRVNNAIILIVFLVIIEGIRLAVNDIGRNITEFNYKPETHQMAYLDTWPGPSIPLPNAGYQKPTRKRVSLSIPTKDANLIQSVHSKIATKYKPEDLTFPEYVPGWGHLPEMSTSEWTLSVHSKLSSLEKDAFQISRKSRQDICTLRGLPMEYKYFDALGNRYWSQLSNAAVGAAKRKIKNIREKQIHSRKKIGRGIVIVW